MSLAQARTCMGEAEAADWEHAADSSGTRAGGHAGARDDEQDLIERAKRDRDAFGALYGQHYPMLANYLYRRTGDVHATEDLVADVFLIALRSLPGYRYRGVPLRFWLLRIATNAVNRWARRQRRRALISLEGDHPTEAAVSCSTDGVGDQRAQRALLSLPPRFQAVLSLHHVEGLSVKETATIVGCREGTVRSRLARARDALREKLNGRR